jgi:hypothetical protein
MRPFLIMRAVGLHCSVPEEIVVDQEEARRVWTWKKYG